MARSPSRVHYSRHRILKRGGMSAYIRDRASGPVYYATEVGKWLWRHPKVTGPLLVAWLLWGTVGGTLTVLIFVLVGVGGLTTWIAWRGRGAEGASKVTAGFSSVGDLLLRQQLKERWPLACQRAKLLGVTDSEVPKLSRLTGDGHGTFTATVECGKLGVPPTDVAKQTVALAGVIGCREVEVREAGPDIARMIFHFKDAMQELLPLADVPPAPPGYLAFGRRADLSPATVRATESVLIGGLTRKGKSNVVRALLADTLRQGIPVDLYVSDVKGGVQMGQFEKYVREELKPGEPRKLLEVRGYAKTPAATLEMLKKVEKRLHVREFHMNAAGTSQVQPDWNNPLVVTIIDETLPLTDLLKKGPDSPLGVLAFTGSAAAYVVWLNAQVGQADVLGRLRDLIPQRICFATPNRHVTDAFLGDGAEAAGATCSSIREAGRGFSYHDGDHGFRQFRAALVNDEEAWTIASGELPEHVARAHEASAILAAEKATASKPRKNRATTLYRIYYRGSRPGIEDGTLGYVGISFEVLQRLTQHDAALREFMNGPVRIETEPHPTRDAAILAEKTAILNEKPLHNKQHNGANPRRRVDWSRARRAKSGAAA